MEYFFFLFKQKNFSGYNASLTGCEAADTDYEMKNQEVKRCKKIENRLKKCNSNCEPAKPSKKKPAKTPPTLKCLRQGFAFPGADLKNLPTADEEECAQQCRDTEKCVALAFREFDRRCFLKSMRGGEFGPSVAAGINSMNIECDNSAVTNLHCVRNGFKFGGASLRNIIVANIEECVRHCRDTEKCVSFSYKKSIRKCFLKFERGGSTGPAVSAAHKSMNIECDDSAVTNMDCLRKGIVFPGNDLGSLVTANEEECVRHCRDTERCVSIAFHEANRTCFLKYDGMGSPGPAKAPGMSSMHMKCNNSAPVNLDCMREGLNFKGATLTDLTVTNKKECVRHCRDYEECVSISFRKSDGRCDLKYKRGGLNGPVVSIGHSSMNMECDNSAVTNLDCMREGIAFPGADIRTVVAADEEECVRICRDTEECVALAFRKVSQGCFLKSQRGGDFGPLPIPGIWSMNMECDNSPVTNLDCLREGINFEGATLRSLKVADEEECVRHCRDTERCVSITISFSIENPICWLKSRRGGEIGPSLQVGLKSMNMECDNSAVSNLNCMRDGFNFEGADLTNLIVADEEECVRHCRDTERCVSIAYRKSTRRCWLKSKRGGEIGPTIGPDNKSMNMECDSNVLTNLDCLRNGINFVGADLRNFIVADLEECVRHCKDTEACVSISFTKSNRECWLKSKRGGSIGPSVRAQVSSMNMECDNSAVSNLDCLREGLVFPGADLTDIITADVEECVRHCRDTEGCVALSFRKVPKKCFLKSSRGGESGPVAASNFKSMNMECDRKEFLRSCVKKDTYFPLAEIRALSVDNIDTCIMLCRDTQVCKAVTFYNLGNRCSMKEREFRNMEQQFVANYKSSNMDCL